MICEVYIAEVIPSLIAIIAGSGEKEIPQENFYFSYIYIELTFMYYEWRFVIIFSLLYKSIEAC